ncbi:MAG: hypothetical protein AAF649_02085 [Verrucomicrobiota bacterium]
MKTYLKTVAIILLMSMISSSYAQQQFEATQDERSSSAIDQEKTRDGKIVQPSQHSSVLVMMSENGLEVFSPGADSKLGVGEKIVTEPVEHEQRVGEEINDKKSYGGIRLFGWFF